MRLYTKICKSCGYTEFYADTKELGAWWSEARCNRQWSFAASAVLVSFGLGIKFGAQFAATANFLSEFATHTCSQHRPVRNAKGKFQFTIPIAHIAVKTKDHVCILDPDRATKRFLTANPTKQGLDRTNASHLSFESQQQ
jgi:hypothetical protein